MQYITTEYLRGFEKFLRENINCFILIFSTNKFIPHWLLKYIPFLFPYKFVLIKSITKLSSKIVCKNLVKQK